MMWVFSVWNASRGLKPQGGAPSWPLTCPLHPEQHDSQVLVFIPGFYLNSHAVSPTEGSTYPWERFVACRLHSSPHVVTSARSPLSAPCHPVRPFIWRAFCSCSQVSFTSSFCLDNFRDFPQITLPCFFLHCCQGLFPKNTPDHTAQLGLVP